MGGLLDSVHQLMPQPSTTQKTLTRVLPLAVPLPSRILRPNDGSRIDSDDWLSGMRQAAS